jgi:hypothetical protein
VFGKHEWIRKECEKMDEKILFVYECKNCKKVEKIE